MDKNTNYSPRDVRAAEARIRLECPDARVERHNFDWSLRVAKPDLSAEFVVYHADETGAFVGDLNDIISKLKS